MAHVPELPRAPEAAASEAERLRLFISGVTGYAIYMLTPEGIVQSWNAGAQRISGYAAAEIIGQHFSRFHTEEDRAAGLPATSLVTARATGKFEGEGWRVRKDGTRFWASVVIDAIFDEAGTLVGYAQIARDITEKKRHDDTLLASEAQFRLLVQGVTDYAIYMLSPTGHITNWNSGAQRIKGYGRDEVVGTHFSRFYTDTDREAGVPWRALETAERQGRFEAEGWRVRKDGTRFWAHVVIDSIRDASGELLGFAKITRDITERRDAAIALEQAREALFQSQKLEAIGKLTGGVAHDFNNLLNVVSNAAALLRQRLKDPADLRMLDTVERATQRGATLTQQLLTFARQQPIKPDRRDVNAVIASFESVLRRASRHGVHFTTELSSRLPPVLIDPAQFETALLNLVVNARDATPDGGSIILSTAAVELSAGQVGRLGPGPYVKVTVRDTGSGMTPEVAARAIEPFFTTKEVGKGTGLGLSQVFGMVQQSGGELVIDSHPGSGATISMYLPALEPLDEPASAAGASQAERALIVDDQPDLLDTTVELFQTLGFEVLAANSGEDALDILRRTPDIKLLFSDVVMPGMSGIELGRRARELRDGLKIILASGYSASLAGPDRIGLDEFDFIPKPYRLADIVKKLRT